MNREQITAAATIIRDSISAKEYAKILGFQFNRAGLAHCPFHAGDKGASLKLYDGRRGWYCFGCHAHGDVVELAKRYYNISYPEALERVAMDAGITLPFQDGRTDERKMKEALKKAEDRARERAREEAFADAVETRYWAAFDEWLAADRLVQELAEEERKHPEQGFSDKFARALLDRQEKKSTLDYLSYWRDKAC